MSTGLIRGSVPAIRPSGQSEAVRLAKRVLRLIEAAFAVAAERRALARLDERLLKDIGLSRSLAARETEREFLDVPEHRIRRG